MGKESDLWDDSALINAFDEAISTYKKMHGIEQHDSSKERGKVKGSTNEGLSTFVEGSQEDNSHPEAYDNSNGASSTTTNLEETNNLLESKRNQFLDSSTEPLKVDLSSRQHVQNAFQEYSNTQGSGDYNQLLNQYYELEEQRQKILQQLQSYSSWNYQSYSPGMQGNTCCASQEYPACTTQYSYPSVGSACCPYVGQCLVAPCCVGGTCVDKTCGRTSGEGHNGISPSPEDGVIVKTAMGAAERAISSLTAKCSAVAMLGSQSVTLQANSICYPSCMHARERERTYRKGQINMKSTWNKAPQVKQTLPLFSMLGILQASTLASI